MEAIMGVLSSKVVLIILAIVLVDFITGTIAALRDGSFSWDEVGNILPKDALGSLVAIGVQIVGDAQGGAVDAIATTGTFAVLLGTIGASIASNIEEITGGRLKARAYVETLTRWILGWARRR